MATLLEQANASVDLLTKKVDLLEAHINQNPSKGAPAPKLSIMEQHAEKCGFHTPQEVERFKNGMWENYKKRNCIKG